MADATLLDGDPSFNATLRLTDADLQEVRPRGLQRRPPSFNPTLSLHDEDMLELRRGASPPAFNPTLSLEDGDLLELMRAKPWADAAPPEGTDDPWEAPRRGRARVWAIRLGLPLLVVAGLLLLAAALQRRGWSGPGPAIAPVDEGAAAVPITVHQEHGTRRRVHQVRRVHRARPARRARRTPAVAARSGRRASPGPVAQRAVRRRQRPHVHGAQVLAARREARRGRWAQARSRAVKALKVAPGDREARAIKRTADRQLRRHRRLVVEAGRSARKRQWVQARDQAAAALRIVPGDRSALAVKRRAERELRRHRRHLAGARRAARGARWSEARRQAAAAIRIVPRDRQARSIKRLAERRLQRERRVL